MKITWKHYSQGEYTYDSIMYVNGKETDNCVSPVSGYYVVYFNNKQIGIADTLKEGKEMILIAGGYIYEQN